MGLALNCQKTDILKELVAMMFATSFQRAIMYQRSNSFVCVCVCVRARERERERETFVRDFILSSDLDLITEAGRNHWDILILHFILQTTNILMTFLRPKIWVEADLQS